VEALAVPLVVPIRETVEAVVKGKTILITGGSGSFGRAFARKALKRNPNKVILLARNEPQMLAAKRDLTDPRMRFFIGDVRDKQRIWRAANGVDIVVHAAALKHVDTLEYNPEEARATNIAGTQNVVEVCADRPIEKAILLSTDKAVAPINIYGVTKAAAERLWMDANYVKPIFTVVRYGNVMGSSGSVLPFWQSLLKRGDKSLPVTDSRMTRFWVDMSDAVEIVEKAIEDKSCYVWVPKVPSFRLVDLAHALNQQAKIVEVGIRPGEKLHETLISREEAQRTCLYKGGYLITPEREYIERGDEPGSTLTEALTSEDAMLVREKRNIKPYFVLKQADIRKKL
jgi:UDP-N-acetylglucosamine 4,6-dehydratase